MTGPLAAIEESHVRRVLRRPLPAVLATAALLFAACASPATEDGGLAEPDTTEAPAAPDEDAPEDDGTGDQASDDVAGDDESAGGPTPDAAEVADPCAEHAGREGEAFLDVAAPVDEQVVEELDGVELVGCSNVYEANVQWELYDGDGVLLDEGFTTAECGSGCVGEFREELDLSAAAGEPFAELHVFSENAADGSRDLLTAIPLVLS